MGAKATYRVYRREWDACWRHGAGCEFECMTYYVGSTARDVWKRAAEDTHFWFGSPDRIEVLHTTDDIDEAHRLEADAIREASALYREALLNKKIPRPLAIPDERKSCLPLPGEECICGLRCKPHVCGTSVVVNDRGQHHIPIGWVAKRAADYTEWKLGSSRWADCFVFDIGAENALWEHTRECADSRRSYAPKLSSAARDEVRQATAEVLRQRGWQVGDKASGYLIESGNS